MNEQKRDALLFPDRHASSPLSPAGAGIGSVPPRMGEKLSAFSGKASFFATRFSGRTLFLGLFALAVRQRLKR